MDGLATSLYGTAAIIFAVAALVFVLQRRTGRMSMSAGPVKAELASDLNEIHRKLDLTVMHSRNTDHAVNNVPKGTPPLVHRVAVVEKRTERMDQTLCKVARHVGVEPVEPDE